MTTYRGACACADPNCRMYGCKLYRPVLPPYYMPVVPPMPVIPGAEVFNTQQEIVDLKRRVAELEKALRQIAGIDPWDNSEQGYVDKARDALTPVRTDSRYNNAERIFGDD